MRPPLGLHHLIAGNHYAPAPWNAKEPRDDWTATYYHRAGAKGIGFDRTTRGGSGAAEQYCSPLREQFDDVRTCPEKFLLWFHHVPWDHRTASGRTLWEELCRQYADGAAKAEEMAQQWGGLAPLVDAQRHREVAERLATQARDAAAWRDQCLRYFQSFSGMPVR